MDNSFITDGNEQTKTGCKLNPILMLYSTVFVAENKKIICFLSVLSYY